MDKYSNFLSTFFTDKTKYAEIQMNGFVLVQQIHGGTHKPIYALYTAESFKNYKKYSQDHLL